MEIKGAPKAMSSAASALSFQLTGSSSEDRILLNAKWVLKILSGLAVSFFLELLSTPYFPKVYF